MHEGGQSGEDAANLKKLIWKGLQNECNTGILRSSQVDTESSHSCEVLANSKRTRLRLRQTICSLGSDPEVFTPAGTQRNVIAL